MAAGLLLLVVGALAVLAGLFTSEGTNVEFLGIEVTAVGLYLIGLGSGVAILWGFGLSKWGTKRSLRQRREARQSRRIDEERARREADEHGEHGQDGDDRSW
jgi:hypothetical protein